MTKEDWLMLAASAYVAFVALLLFAHWWRKRLLRWAQEEMRWLEKEQEELARMRKFLMERFTWDRTRSHYGNPVMNAAFEGRVDEYNRRRQQWFDVKRKACKLLPW